MAELFQRGFDLRQKSSDLRVQHVLVQLAEDLLALSLPPPLAGRQRNRSGRNHGCHQRRHQRQQQSAHADDHHERYQPANIAVA